jgi:hypothetical protein
MTPDEATRQALAEALEVIRGDDGDVRRGMIVLAPDLAADAILATDPGSRLTVSESQKLSDSSDPDAERQRAIGEAVERLPDDQSWDIVYERPGSGDDVPPFGVVVWSSGGPGTLARGRGDTLPGAIAAALPAAQEPERRCGCRVDAELGAGAVCPACGHRDHGRSGCTAQEPER